MLTEQELNTVFVNWREIIMCNTKLLKYDRCSHVKLLISIAHGRFLSSATKITVPKDECRCVSRLKSPVYGSQVRKIFVFSYRFEISNMVDIENMSLTIKISCLYLLHTSDFVAKEYDFCRQRVRFLSPGNRFLSLTAKIAHVVQTLDVRKHYVKNNAYDQQFPFAQLCPLFFH